MRALWKWLAILPAFFLLSAIVLLLLAERLVDSDYLKQQLAEQAAQQGYQLQIEQLNWKLLPQPHLQLRQATVTASDQAAQRASVDTLAVYVSLRALLTQQLDIQQLTLADLRVHDADQTRLQLNQLTASISDLNNRGRPFALRGELNGALWSASVQYAANNPQQTSLTIDISRLDLDAIVVPASANPASAPALHQTNTVPTNTTPPAPATASDPQALGLAITGILRLPGHYQLRIGQLRAYGIDASELQFTAQVSGQTIRIEQLDAQLYQGSARHTGQFSLGTNQQLETELNASYQNIELGQLSTALQGETASLGGGTLNGSAHFNSRGINSQTLTENLHGELTLNVSQALIRQFNLEHRLCDSATNALQLPAVTQSWLTDTTLQQLNFNGRIQRGVLHIQQLNGLLDSANLSGKGAIDLGRQIADVKISAKLTQAHQQANTCPAINSTLREIAWPLRCEGSYRQRAFGETCGVDQKQLQKIVAERLLKKALDNDKSSIIDKLKNLFR